MKIRRKKKKNSEDLQIKIGRKKSNEEKKSAECPRLHKQNNIAQRKLKALKSSKNKLYIS